ncbi:MAG: hypothetical protein ACC662_03570 [Planctomycetota bacterium]
MVRIGLLLLAVSEAARQAKEGFSAPRPDLVDAGIHWIDPDVAKRLARR